MNYKFLVLILILISSSGCVQPPRVPPQTQLQIREFQTRYYENKDTLTAMKAVINALQDDAFIIKNADKDLGFIQATKELDIEDKGTAFAVTIFGGQNARWSKNSIIESSVNLTTIARQTKVRVIFQKKVLDNMGGAVSIEQIDDARFYQEFFQKVDKSLFIEKQNF